MKARPLFSDSEVLKVPVEKIEDNPLNRKIYNKTEDSAFVQSIKEQGILEPLVLTPDYTIISGSRRLAASRRLKLRTVPALVRKFSNDNVALVEFNRYRQKTPIEIFREAHNIATSQSVLQQPVFLLFYHAHFAITTPSFSCAPSA